MSLQQLVDVRACEQLKYRYCRLLDQKRFDELGALLTEDCTVAYGGGASRKRLRRRHHNPPAWAVENKAAYASAKVYDSPSP